MTSPQSSGSSSGPPSAFSAKTPSAARPDLRDLLPTEEQLAALTPDERAEFQERFERVLNHKPPWPTVARPNQLPSQVAFFIWLILAGRGWGKTRTGAEFVAEKARRYPGVRIALVAQKFGDGRDTMVEGESGLLSVFDLEELRGHKAGSAWNRSLGELFLANGSQFKIFSSEKPNQLRGPQHHFAWGDEACHWLDAHKGPVEDTTFSNMLFGCRLTLDGSEPQIVLTSTPRPVALLTKNDEPPLGLLHRSSVVLTKGHSDENEENLPATYRAEVLDPVRGTRLGRQEIAAEILEDVPGALWKRAWIDETRVATFDPAHAMHSVIALDPADGTAHGAEQGLVVASLSASDHHIYVRRSDGTRKDPGEWLADAVRLALLENARIVVEKNHGGAYLTGLLKKVMEEMGESVPVEVVNASQGKLVRAEGPALLYERRLVHHVGIHAALEEQMTSYTGEGRSPDLMDAAVWAIVSLAKRGNVGGFTASADTGRAVPYTDSYAGSDGAVPWDGDAGTLVPGTWAWATDRSRERLSPGDW